MHADAVAADDDPLFPAFAAPFAAERCGALADAAAADAAWAAEHAVAHDADADADAWDERIDAVRVAAQLRRDAHAAARAVATLRAGDPERHVDVDAALGRAFGDAHRAWVRPRARSHPAPAHHGRRADPYLATLYDAVVVESARHHVRALDAALCHLGGLHPSQQLPAVAAGLDGFFDHCAATLGAALTAAPRRDTAVAVAVARLRDATLADHVRTARRSVQASLATLVAVGQLAAQVERDGAPHDGLLQTEIEHLAALVAAPPPDLVDALARSGARLDALRWVLGPAPPTTPWLAPSVATRAELVRRWLDAHSAALAWACNAAIHDARALLRRPCDDPLFVGIGWAPDAPEAGRRTVAAPPAPHLPADAHVRRPRFASLAAPHAPPCGVRAARLLCALSLEASAGLLPPRVAAARALLPIVERLAVELECHHVGEAGHGVGEALREHRADEGEGLAARRRAVARGKERVRGRLAF